MLFQMVGELVNGDPVHSCATFITLHLPQCFFQVFSLTDFLHQSVGSSWVFGSTRAAGRVCTNTSGDAGMKKASTRLLEQETQTPSPAPDLIPAESSTENLHWDWYSKRGTSTGSP